MDENKMYQQIAKVVETILDCARWAYCCRPQLVHLALRARKRRTRKKNLVRIVKEYIREV